MDPKEIFIQEHERLMAEYLETHPNVSEADAYERVADAAYDAMRDRFADVADDLRRRAKDGQS